MSDHAYRTLMRTPLALAVAALSLLSLKEARAELEPSQAFHEYRANQSLLAKIRRDREEWVKESATNPSPAIERKLVGANYKVQALEEDAERLKLLVTPEERQLALLSVEAEGRTGMQTPSESSTAAADKPIAEAPETPAPAPSTLPAELPTHAMHEKALKLVAEQKIDEALKIYQDIVLQDPGDDEAYMIMGHCYLLQGSYSKAEQAFNSAVHIDPSNVTEIVPFYENMTLQSPNDDTVFANLGYALVIVGEFPRAKEAFQDAIRINPGNQAAHRGIALIESGQPTPSVGGPQNS